MKNDLPPHMISSRIVVLSESNIDTDQIIPARFLTTTSKAGLGKLAFNDWRYDEKGAPKPDFALNRIDAREHQILVGGDNFGCGSSREHAPWALTDFGFKAVISTSIADIFSSNSLKNGLLPIVVSKDVHEKLLTNPTQQVLIDIEAQTLTLEDGTVESFPIEAFAKTCLLEGVDAMGYLIKRIDKIKAFEEAHHG